MFDNYNMVAVISEHQAGDHTCWYRSQLGVASFFSRQDAFQQLRDHRYADFLGTKEGAAEIPGVPAGIATFQLHFEV